MSVKLTDVIPFRRRVGSWVGKKWSDWKHSKFRVVAYIDSRDVMDHLDKCYSTQRSREHKEINWTVYCWITIHWVTRRDAGTKSNIEQEKWEASDSFKRAAVNRWVGRFLYTIPSFIITKEEAIKYQRTMNEFIRKKFNKELTKWYADNKVKEELQSKYHEEELIREETPKSIEDVINPEDRSQ